MYLQIAEIELIKESTNPDLYNASIRYVREILHNFNQLFPCKLFASLINFKPILEHALSLIMRYKAIRIKFLIKFLSSITFVFLLRTLGFYALLPFFFLFITILIICLFFLQKEGKKFLLFSDFCLNASYKVKEKLTILSKNYFDFTFTLGYLARLGKILFFFSVLGPSSLLSTLLIVPSFEEKVVTHAVGTIINPGYFSQHCHSLFIDSNYQNHYFKSLQTFSQYPQL